MKNVWENPEIQQLNRLPMRSPLIPFDSPEKAVSETVAGLESVPETASSFVKSLDGTWKFMLLDNPLEDSSQKLKNWVMPNFSDGGWHDIKVPGTWTMQGFDYPHYTNVQMPFDTLPPNVPEKNPTGLYRKEMELPAAWKNRRVVLHIGSAESVTIVYVNGTEVGISKDTRLPCEFDITHYIDWSGSKGKAVISIKVVRYSDASFVEDQDQWWFGGIHRSVYVYSTEETFIEDVEALSYYENTTGVIPLVVTLGYSDTKNEVTRVENKTMDNLKRIVTYTVHKINGTPQKGTASAKVAHGICEGVYDYRKTLNQVRTEIKIKNVELWSSEHPNLYAVTVSLYDIGKDGKAGKHIESTSFTTGFKSVEVKNRELLLNGKKVYIHGVNRHEHSETMGKTISLEQMVKEIHMLKAYNFNAVRTCHYPDDHRWYDLCDRYGIYILDEANIENHAYYDGIPRSDAWTNSYMTRIQRMVRRDKNHACIFGWSLGNESGDGQNQVAAAAWIRRVDKTRIVHYEGFVRGELHQTEFSLDTLARGKGLTDLIGPMYPSIDLICKYVDTREDYRPIIMCEYSHAMGNANGSLSDYWEAIESHHGLQGGFIWDWIDQGIKAIAPEGKAGEPQGGVYWKYGGDFGDTPSDYDFCLNGINFPDMTPKPAMEECRKLFAPVKLYALHPQSGIFEVENKFDFTTLDVLKLSWKLLKNGSVIKSGVLQLPKVKPHERTQISLSISKEALDASVDGSEVVFHADFIYAGKTAWGKAGEICGYDECVLYAANGLSVITASAAGKKASFSADTVSSIISQIRPELFRPLTENECVKRRLAHRHETAYMWNFIRTPTNEWLDVGLDDLEISVKKQTMKKIVLSLDSGKSALKKINIGTVEISENPCTSPTGDAAVQLDVVFNLSKKVSEYPRVGISFPVSANYTTASWYGRGPHENYSDRKASAMLGLYTSEIKKLEVPYIVPQENGNRSDVTYLELKGASSDVLHIQSEKPFVFSVSSYDADDVWKCEHHNELVDLSKGDDGNYIVTIDAAHRGVGTGACGPDTMEPYKVRPGVYRLSLVIW